MLGISLATRTTEELSLSGQEADTTRVFNAAETGIEQALWGIQTGALSITDAAPTPIPSISQLTGSDLQVTGERASSFDMSIAQGDVLTLEWNNNTEVDWIHAADCSDAAAVIVTLYNTTGATASHVAYNPYGASTACDKGSGFLDDSTGAVALYSAGSVTGSKVVLNQSSFGLATAPGSGSIIRIRPLYAEGNFHIANSSAIQLVSTASDSTGGVGSSAETRRIQVIRTEPAAPSVFDYAVFSGGDLAKN